MPIQKCQRKYCNYIHSLLQNSRQTWATENESGTCFATSAQIHITIIDASAFNVILSAQN